MSFSLRGLVVTTAFAGVLTATALIACTEHAPLAPPGCSGSKCDGGTPATEPPTEEPTVDSVCADEAAAYCDELIRCFPDSSASKDRAACIDGRTVECKGWFSAPGTSRTLERMSDCARDRRTLDCEKVYGGGIPDSCKILPGTLANGRVCSDDAQCSGRLCRRAATGECGVCTKLPGAGDDCSQVYVCDADLTCDMNVCVTPGKVGASCKVDEACAANLRCVSGACTPAVALGAACVPDGDNAPCARGYCNDATHVCTEYKTSTPGGPCANAGPDRAQCPANYGCAVGDGQTTGTCVKVAAAPGESCVDGQRTLACTGGAKCLAGVCTISSTASSCQ